MADNLGENLKRIRKERGLDQFQLAYMLQVSDKTISSWEVNRTEPKMGMVERLASVLKCTKSDLLGIEPESVPELDSKMKYMLSHFPLLEENEKDIIINTISAFLSNRSE